MNGTRKPRFDASRITKGVAGKKFYLFPVKTSTPSQTKTIIKNE